MAKHTPGPWLVEQWDTPTPVTLAGSLSVTQDDGGDVVAWLEDAPRANANARMIAAAPEMLTMLERLVESHARLERERGSVVATYTDDARALLARIEG